MLNAHGADLLQIVGSGPGPKKGDVLGVLAVAYGQDCVASS